MLCVLGLVCRQLQGSIATACTEAVKLTPHVSPQITKCASTLPGLAPLWRSVSVLEVSDCLYHTESTAFVAFHARKSRRVLTTHRRACERTLSKRESTFEVVHIVTVASAVSRLSVYVGLCRANVVYSRCSTISWSALGKREASSRQLAGSKA